MPISIEKPKLELPVEKDVHSSMDSPEFLQDLKKSGNQYIGFQSVLDALDLWNSSIKLYFDAVDYQSSAADLNEWLSCPIGAACFFLGAAFMSSIAYLGNGVAKSPEQSELSKQADTYWPYLRDMLKGMKWTFKGTRSFMIVVSVLGQYQLIRYLTPVGLGLGVLSACNRMWNRSMVETRKTLQEQNDAFRRQVKGIHACFHEVGRDLVWDEDGKLRQDILENIYAGSILKIPTTNLDGFEYYHVHQNGKIEGPVKESPFFKTLNKELENIRKSVPNQKIVPRLYWDKFKILIENTPTITQSELAFFNQVLDEKTQHLQQLLDPSSKASQFIHNRAVFQTNSKKALASAAFSGLLNAPYYFLGLLSSVVLPHTIFIAAVSVCTLFMVLNIAAELYQENDYQRRLRISQLKANLVKTKRLLVIEWQQANLELIQENHLQLYKERSSEDSLILDEQIISDDTSPLNGINDNDSALKREIIALLNLLQEDQKPLREILEKFLQTDITNKPAHKMSKDTIAYLEQRFSDYQNIDKQLSALGFKEKQHIETLKHCIKIAKYEQDYYQQYAQLDDQLRLSKGSIWWQGLRNGLVVFGAFNSLLMTVASMNLLFGIGFTPMFFYVSIIAGLTLLFFTTLYTLLSVNSKEDNIADDQDCPQFKTSNIFVAASTMKIIDDKDIQASQNLLISEHSEVFRQLLSGFKKGIKFLQTLSVFLLPLGQSDSVLTKLSYIATGMIFSVFFALKGLRGLMRVDEEAYKNSFIYKFLVGAPSEKETKSISNTDAAPLLESPKKLPRVPSIFRTTDELMITSRLSPIPQGL